MGTLNVLTTNRKPNKNNWLVIVKFDLDTKDKSIIAILKSPVAAYLS